MRYGIRTLLIVTVFAGGLIALIRLYEKNAILQDRVKSLELGAESRRTATSHITSRTNFAVTRIQWQSRTLPTTNPTTVFR